MTRSASRSENGVDALVLRLQDYREADRLVWLLTSERGRVSCVARGARKSRKRFGGHLDLFQRVRVRLHSGKGTLHALVECRAIDAWPALRSDVERFAAASYVAELAGALAPEEAEDAAFYDAVAGALALLATPAGALSDATVAAIAVQLLTTSGFVMDLSACGSCGRSLDSPATGGALLEPGGRLVCTTCALPSLANRPALGACLSAADAATLARWQSAPLPQASRAVGGSGAVAAARSLVHEVVGKTLKSEAFLWSLLAGAVPS